MEPPKRNNLFAGRLLSADDLTAEQDYFLGRHRRHNRLLHGSGVVEGLDVSVTIGTAAPSITVGPGYALDPLGNEICVCTATILPLPPRDTSHFVVVGYRECLTDPVPVTSDPAGPDSTAKPSRVADTFELLLSAELAQRRAYPCVDVLLADRDAALRTPGSVTGCASATTGRRSGRSLGHVTAAECQTPVHEGMSAERRAWSGNSVIAALIPRHRGQVRVAPACACSLDAAVPAGRHFRSRRRSSSRTRRGGSGGRRPGESQDTGSSGPREAPGGRRERRCSFQTKMASATPGEA
jgi:hypothetical protein